jgi:hypothetical protein
MKSERVNEVIRLINNVRITAEEIVQREMIYV